MSLVEIISFVLRLKGLDLGKFHYNREPSSGSRCIMSSDSPIKAEVGVQAKYIVGASPRRFNHVVSPDDVVCVSHFLRSKKKVSCIM